SDKLNNIVSNLSLFSSLANIHGVVSSTYLLALLTNFQISSNALEKFSSSTYSSTSLAIFTPTSFKDSSISSSKLISGIIPLLYFSIIVTVLLNKFPKSFAKSEFTLCKNFFLVNDPSLPKENSLNRKYLKASMPYNSIIGSGYIIFPLDFDILSSSNNIHPCPKTCLGNSISRPINKAGQIIVWNLTISLAIKCTPAGQYFLKFSSLSEPYPRAVI